MLTVFSVPKALSGHIGVIQRNAIRSWARLRPACQIILCGDDDGVKEAADEFGIQHIADVELNEYGTPLLNSIFHRVRHIASYPLMCYVNTDIILLSDFLAAIRRIRFQRFLAVGQRWDVEVTEPWDLEGPDGEEELRRFATTCGRRHPPLGSDFFVFPTGTMLELPPFAVGRPGWDNWMIYRARSMRFPVVDVSRVTTVIHQDHDYSHVIKVGSSAVWEGPEADRNRDLVGGGERVFTLADATHLLTRRALIPALGPVHLRRRWQTLPVLRPGMRPLVLAVNWPGKLAMYGTQRVVRLARRNSGCGRANER